MGNWRDAADALRARGVGVEQRFEPEEMREFVDQYEALLGNQPKPKPALIAALQASQLGDQPVMNELRKMVVRAQIPDEYAGPWRVSLSEPPRNQAGVIIVPQTSVEMVNVRCEVTWGVAGARSTVRFDYRQGLSFSVFGSYLEVLILVPDVQVFRLGAHATYGHNGPTTEVVQSVDYGNILAAANTVLAIPAFATHVRHSIGDVVPNTPRVMRAQRTPAGVVTLERWDFLAAAGGNTNPVYQDWKPLPEGATLIDIENTSGVTLLNTRVYYKLGL